jgi:tetratricopeptide (TPR) repeat protein
VLLALVVIGAFAGVGVWGIVAVVRAKSMTESQRMMAVGGNRGSDGDAGRVGDLFPDRVLGLGERVWTTQALPHRHHGDTRELVALHSILQTLTPITPRLPHHGRVTDGLALLDEAVSLAETKNRSARGIFLALQSEALLLAGRPDEARRAASRGLEGARPRRERGAEVWNLRALGDVAAHGEPPDVVAAEGYFQQALALAKELGMRPLVARCHAGLAKLYRRTGKQQEAEEHLSIATTMYREMGMTYWQEKAEAEMRYLS